MNIVICGDVMFENDCKASEIATKTGNGISLFLIVNLMKLIKVLQSHKA